MYQLLSSLYMQSPDPDFLKSLSGWVASLDRTSGPTQFLSPQIKQGLDGLDSFFRKIGDDSWTQSVEAISVEFTRLFRGVKRQYSPPPPYESLYLEDSGRVFGDTTFTVHQQYRRFGLDLVTELSSEPPDHISFELDFMRLLCHQESEAWAKDNQDEVLRLRLAEREFLSQHLILWLPGLCDQIRKHDRLGLFRALADLTEGWVNFDYQQHLQQAE
jgi:TorA maturation chaperone TorD